jgi:hypothetical protein
VEGLGGGGGGRRWAGHWSSSSSSGVAGAPVMVEAEVVELRLGKF